MTRARPCLAALMLGAVSATGFEPLHLWPLTLLCLAALIGLLQKARTARGAFVIGYLFGLGQFTVGLNWIAQAFVYQDAMPHWLGWLAVPLLSLYLAVYPAFGLAVAWIVADRRPVALVVASAGSWALSEYLRATLFTGFAWNPLGVIWLGTGVDRSAVLIGTYGLGLLAMLAGGGLWLSTRPRRRIGAGLLLAMLMIGLAGRWMTPPPRDTGIAVRVVQPDIGQDEKYAPSLEWRNLGRLAFLSGRPSSGARLIFWPEGAVYAILDMEPAWRARLAALLGADELLLVGGDKYYLRDGALAGANNSLWVLDARGRIRGRYDKAHLVPYGEYLPMRPILSAIGLSRLVQGDVDFWPGEGPRTLPLPPRADGKPLNMAVQICYEIIFSGQVIDPARRPDFLFNPSNDAWFGSWGPPQHLAQARLRAIEEAVPIIRSTPTGISAIVDAEGRIRAALPHERAGYIDAPLPTPARATLFSRFGNAIPLLLAALMLVSGVALARARR